MRTSENRSRRVMALILCALLLVTIMAAAVCVVCRAHHICCGEGCAICDCLGRCEELMRAAGSTMAVVCLPLLACAAGAALLVPCFVSATPASQRVRMND